MPAYFNTLLDRFERLAAVNGVTAQCAARIANWRFHCQACGEYRHRQTNFPSYADYLSDVHRDDPHAKRVLLTWFRQRGEWQRVHQATSDLLRQEPIDSSARWMWISYRAEAELALGDTAAAEADIRELARSPHAVWQRRARQ